MESSCVLCFFVPLASVSLYLLFVQSSAMELSCLEVLMVRPKFCCAVQNARRGYGRGLQVLSLIPENQGCGMVEQITQGIRIRASAVYCPERSTDCRLFFTYRCEAR